MRKSSSGHEVEYYDTLEPLHPRAFAGAHLILSLLGLPKEGLKSKANASKQASDDCGWYLCHYIEEALRRLAGHMRNSQGWPETNRLLSMQAWLTKIIGSLELERVKWADEVKKEKEAEALFEASLQERAKAYLEHKGLLARVLKLHAALASELMHAGAAVELPPLDTAFLLRLEQHTAEVKAKRQERALGPPPLPPPLEAPALEAASVVEAPPLEAAPAEAPPVEPAILAEEPNVEAAPAEAPPLEAALAEPSAEDVEKLKEHCANAKDLDVFELVLRTTKLEDLRPDLQAHMAKVRLEGLGVCSRCRYLGCLSCNVEKAWRYCIKVELGLAGLPRGKAKALAKASGGGPSLEAYHY